MTTSHAGRPPWCCHGHIIVSVGVVSRLRHQPNLPLLGSNSTQIIVLEETKLAPNLRVKEKHIKRRAARREQFIVIQDVMIGSFSRELNFVHGGILAS